MNITRHHARDLFRQMSDQMDRFMNDPFGIPQLADDSQFDQQLWLPAVDIKEDDDRFLVRADLPGVDPKDIEVNLENGVLTISGKRESEKKDQKDGYRRVEREYGEFYRQFTLPNAADGEKVSAKCDKGVLEVTIGKTEAHKPKRIAVKAQ